MPEPKIDTGNDSVSDLQRIGCEHPFAAEVTTLGDPNRLWVCTSCGAEWCTKGRR